MDRQLSGVRAETMLREKINVPRGQRLSFANDHAGFVLREPVLELLRSYAEEIIDVGARSDDPVDFPDITQAAIAPLQEGRVERVILLCGTGAGACIAANKIRGVRAAVAHDTYVARQIVEHDDVNVLCVGAWITGPQIAMDIIRQFLAATFSNHEPFIGRVAKLTAIEDGERRR